MSSAAILALALLLAITGPALAAWHAMRKRNMQIWLPQWIFRKRPPVASGPIHVMFCFVDHFEPMHGKVGLERQRARVDRWCRDYRALAQRHRDADGRPPQHGFFYPEEEYLEEHLAKIASLCRDGYGEIEVHLHHDNDTADNFRACISRFKQLLHWKHGALPVHPVTGEIGFAFIHGNWCLDNSLPGGGWCGLNDELTLLRDLGCYADFTMPSAPSPTQTKTINSIYYAVDDPHAPKSHDTGTPARAGVQGRGDLLLVQGPLGLNWRDRRHGFLPRVENSDIRANHPPTPGRVDTWIEAGIHVQGRPEWRFVKIHTHGAPEAEADVVLGPEVDAMFSYLEERYNDGERYVLHYVTPREVYNIIKAAEAGHGGDPGQYRDFILPAPSSSYSAQRARA
ncbi:MAG: hypothetical protein GX538_07695 [Gammaproteobacteria bacterium]|nr:hypothetical protein [Gammaproteobacteria bacterium]